MNTVRKMSGMLFVVLSLVAAIAFCPPAYANDNVSPEANPLAIVDGTPIKDVFTGEDGILAEWVASILGKDVADGVTAAELATITEIDGDKFTSDDRAALMDWSGIENLTGLELLNLSGCPLSNSSINDIKGLSSLETINFSASQISATLADFNEITSLKSICLSFTAHVSGALSDLKDLVNLNRIEIAPCRNITGALTDFLNWPQLERIYLAAIDLSSSDLSDLSTHPNLENFKAVYMPENDIKGNVEVFSKCTQLEYFALNDTPGEESGRVTGSLDFLGSCPNLKSVGMNSTAVTGLIDTMFAGNDNIEMIILNCPGITGNLSVFSGTTELNYVHFEKSQIEGDIAHLSGNNWLSHLCLNSKGVTGNLSDFLSNMNEIVYFNIANTSLSGSLADIGTRGAYQYINASGVGITGDLSDLTESFTRSAMFMNLNLSDNPAITGDIALFSDLYKENSLTALSTLNLKNTAVSGDVATLAVVDSLQAINLSETSV
ncbi:MAG: hypothetical protein ACOYD7_07120 [Raoultibacter sp.]|jgi:hypothetical protein